MKGTCVDGSCQYRSIAGLLKDLLRLAKKWHEVEVVAGRLTNENWEEHYATYVAERLTPYLTSLQAHSQEAEYRRGFHDGMEGGANATLSALRDGGPVAIPLSTPEERAGTYDPRFAIPSPASVGAEATAHAGSE